MQAISHKAVKVTNGFWQERQRLNADVTVRAVYDRFSDTHRFAVINPLWKNPFVRSHIFYDSDTAKWLESVAYVLDDNREKYAELEKLADAVIAQFVALQAPNGYLNSYYQRHFFRIPFLNRNNHELYCAGHLAEAAVAYYKATGKDALLKAAEKYLSYIRKRFIVQGNTGFTTPGHEEIELALWKMYELTEKETCKEMAEFFLEKRGRTKDKPIYSACNQRQTQSHVPIREQTEAVGHCVRALYLYSAMADMARINRERELFDTCKTLYQDIVTKTYITGGVGSDYVGECFTVPYDLPNKTAYSESCAAIALLLFSQRMLLAERDVRYADTVESVLYNTLLSSTSLDGKKFFYENPLEIRLAEPHKNTSNPHKERLPITQRVEVFSCSCCPPNVTRTIASVGDYLYTEDAENLYLHQFIGSRYTSGEGYIDIVTNYPADGIVRITGKNLSKKLWVRIPSWCKRYKVIVNGEERNIVAENGYFPIEESDFDCTLSLEMQPCFVRCNPLCVQNRNALALCYGPVVYCVEGVDNGCLDTLAVKQESVCSLAKGLTALPDIIVEGYRLSMSSTYGNEEAAEKTSLRFIPYFAFANRGESDMKVWIPAFF